MFSFFLEGCLAPSEEQVTLGLEVVSLMSSVDYLKT